jgi:3-oxoacyl-[acyl-carrier protein] reductase
MTNLTNHKALITGASRGIGAAIVSELKNQGIEIIAPKRSELDLSQPDSIAAYIALHKDFGIDILINNAGISILNDVQNINDKDWQTIIQVNLTAPMQLIKGFSPAMKTAGWGRIVNISSIFSLVTREKRSAYSVTKAGLNALTRSAALEFAPYGILVNAVCPGYVGTELTFANNSPEQLAAVAASIPLQRLAEPDEIAKLVVFLCSQDNTYLTGQSIIIDGGFTCK